MRSKLEKKRISFIDRTEEALFAKVRNAQNFLYTNLLEVISEFDLDPNGRIKFSTKNIRKQQRVNLIIERFNKQRSVKITSWLQKRIVQLFTFNKQYFRSVTKLQNKTVDNRVRKKIMLQFGYDEVEKKIIKNSWLHNVTNNTGIVNEIIQEFQQGLTAKMPLGQFKKQFRERFLGGENQGLVEQSFYRQTNDVFASYDRAIQNEYSEELDFNYAIYAHTVKDNTRDFCLSRINRIYTREEIKSWDSLDWKGKKKVHNSLTDQGGYNCRGSYSWISKELAERLAKQRGIEINSYQ